MIPRAKRPGLSPRRVEQEANPCKASQDHFSGLRLSVLTHLRRVAAVAGLLTALAAPAWAGPRVYSLDQCADQYVLALSPRADIVGLSERARNGDSYLRAQVGGLPLHRATTESTLAARPDVVVREWGGDERLALALQRRGIAVVQIDEADDFVGVRANVRKVAAALGNVAGGEALVRHMDAQLSAAAGAQKGRGVLYVTPGGDTAGSGTLVGAMLTAAGFSNLAGSPGYSTLTLEHLVASPPSAMVLGFFTDLAAGTQHWTLAGNGRFRALARRRAVASLPGSILGCPAWFAGDAVASLAKARN
jgi:iron complex transport system substrate-binding protein